MKILLTGFDPFGGEKINPAFEAVKLVKDRISGAEIVKLEIPTVIGKCDKIVAQAVREQHPDVLLSIGQAGGRADITVEQVAINIVDARIPDNEGNQPHDLVIREDGPAAYFATFPVRSIVERMKSYEVPASISYTAGTYVCNFIMYCNLYLAAKEYPTMKSGFIHVPFSTSQALNKPTPVPSMSMDTMVKAIEAAIEAIVEA